jgi:hypothetical protein
MSRRLISCLREMPEAVRGQLGDGRAEMDGGELGRRGLTRLRHGLGPDEEVGAAAFMMNRRLKWLPHSRAGTVIRYSGKDDAFNEREFSYKASVEWPVGAAGSKTGAKIASLERIRA